MSFVSKRRSENLIRERDYFANRKLCISFYVKCGIEKTLLFDFDIFSRLFGRLAV